jgi:hypothetical protein
MQWLIVLTLQCFTVGTLRLCGGLLRLLLRVRPQFHPVFTESLRVLRVRRGSTGIRLHASNFRALTVNNAN